MLLSNLVLDDGIHLSWMLRAMYYVQCLICYVSSQAAVDAVVQVENDVARGMTNGSIDMIWINLEVITTLPLTLLQHH